MNNQDGKEERLGDRQNRGNLGEKFPDYFFVWKINNNNEKNEQIMKDC